MEDFECLFKEFQRVSRILINHLKTNNIVKDDLYLKGMEKFKKDVIDPMEKAWIELSQEQRDEWMKKHPSDELFKKFCERVTKSKWN